MRAVVQRCTRASVSVDGEVISSINQGLCILLGIAKEDTQKDLEYMVRKLLNLRLFDDEQGKRWSHSVKEKNLEVLLVSQFTLCSTLKGNKPDFRGAMEPERSREFYSQFLDAMKKSYEPQKIKDGKFGALMQVELQNDGPVTIQLESPCKNTPTEE